MSKRNPRKFGQRSSLPEATAKPAAAQATKMDFTFGDPEPVMDRRQFFDYLECVKIGKWYAPPISMDGLARTFVAAVHHSSPILVKKNILVKTFVPHKKFSTDQFAQLALDFLVFGNAYLDRTLSRLGNAISYQAVLAKYMRVGVEPGTMVFVSPCRQDHEYAAGSVFHLREPDINQEIYGMPQYFSALQSVWLNESATLFRRRYYLNGSHAGFIFYMTDAAQKQEDVDALKEAFRNAKGPGNFKNLFLYAPGGKKDGVQLIPVSEVAAKDEFVGIKNVTRDDMLAAHRVPPQLMGIIPNNTGGFGDVEKAAAVFAANEIEPLQTVMLAINTWAGEEIIRFKPYTLSPS